jgi:hypothetical protein
MRKGFGLRMPPLGRNGVLANGAPHVYQATRPVSEPSRARVLFPSMPEHRGSMRKWVATMKDFKG